LRSLEMRKSGYKHRFEGPSQVTRPERIHMRTLTLGLTGDVLLVAQCRQLFVIVTLWRGRADIIELEASGKNVASAVASVRN